MTSLTFSQKLAQSLYEATEQFPVDLDDAWQWSGYSDKRHAEDALKAYFIDGTDFSLSGQKVSTGGRPAKRIVLTVDCFKQLAMISKSEQGKQVRLYFLECERIAKSTTPKTSLELAQLMLDELKRQEQEMTALKAAQSELSDRIDSVEAEQERMMYPGGRYYTVMGFSNLHHHRLTLTQSAQLGRKATEVCKGLGIRIEPVSDPRFGRIGSYPENVLIDLMTELFNK